MALLPTPTSTTGFGSFGSFGGSQADLSTSEGLYNLAQLHGGAVAQAANELYHPTTGILSSISTGMKNAFRGFVNIISTPSEVVAGILSPTLSIKDAISQHVTPSDVIFGEKDPNASIYQKVGSFVVRTATDVMLDPLTYITFGTGTGLLGLKRGAEITLREAAAQQTGKEIFSKAALSGEGQKVYNYLRKLTKQMNGNLGAEIAKTGNSVLDLASDELRSVMAATIDSPLSEDFAKKAISNLLEKQPSFAATLIDKGGIKFFGQTLLSAQRLSATMKMVPGMTALDHITAQPRLALQSLFNPAVIKDSRNQWVRVPGGIVDMAQQYRDVMLARTSGQLKKLDDVVSTFKLDDTQARFLMASVENKTLPADKNLAGAMKYMLGYSDQEFDDLVKAGLLTKETRLENYAPHILVKTKTKDIPYIAKAPSSKTPASKLREIATYTPIKTAEGKALVGANAITGHAGSMGLENITEGVNKGLFQDAKGNLFRREIAPVHGTLSAQQLADIEQTMFKDPKRAAAMMDELKADGLEGFDDNLMTAWAARSIQNQKALVSRDFLRSLAADFGAPASASPEGFVRIASESMSKELESAKSALQQLLTKEGDEIVFHPAIAAYVEKMMKSLSSDESTMEFLKAYDKIQNFWKASVTSIWPAFHGRNAISNVLQNFLDIGVNAINPKTNAASLNLMYIERRLAKLERQALKSPKAQAEIGRLMSREMFTDVAGNKWTYGELRQVAKNHNIAFTGRVLSPSDAKLGATEGSKRALFGADTMVSKVTSKATVPLKIGQSIGTMVEEHARLTNFLHNLRVTGDVTTAAKRTKQFLFDYSNLTNFERQVMRRIIPFYTFTRKNLELQVRALLTTPGKLAAEVHAINTLGEVLSGGHTLTEDEYNALPDWVKSGVGILTKKRGDQITLITNLGTPLEQPFQMMQAKVILGSVSPLIRVPIEQGAGYSFFQGKPLSEATNAAAFVHAPKFIQDLIGYTELSGTKSDGSKFTWYVSLHPEMMNLILNLPPTSRVFSALKQMDAVDVDQQAKIFQQLTGVRPYSFDLERERQKRENEMKRQLEELLTKAGVTAQFKTTYIPKAKKASLY